MKRSKFSLSHTRLFSCNMGNLIPMCVMEVLPGDTFQHNTSMLLRCAPLLAPVMHPVRVRIHHWYVPYRLLWTNWENFITGGPDGNNASVFPVIHMPDTVGFPVGSLADYMGCAVNVSGTGGTRDVSALPFRAYAKIFNECYRDQDLVTAVGLGTGDGVDATTNTALLRAAWEKDYFTSARPWEQKGPAVTIPLGNSAPVTANGQAPNFNFSGGGNRNFAVQTGGQIIQVGGANPGAQQNVTSWGTQTGMQADLSSASAITVTLLREALSMQRYEEARARYGSRYVEYLRYLGVRSSDARLDRPEYLGGGFQTIQFSEVLQTAEGTDPVGTMAGHGIATAKSNRYRRFFEEHGVILSLLSVIPAPIYMNGQNRMWNKRSKEEFWQKEFEHIGQQEVLNKEVYAAHATPLGTFGYQNRYEEYRYMESRISGEFRSTLDMWHFGRQFGSDPALNSAFVTATPTEEPFAVPSTDVLYVMAKHSVQARRMVSASTKSFIY